MIALVLRAAAEGAIRDGRIAPKGKTRSELHELFAQEWRRVGRSRRKRPFALLLDHRPVLLREARRLAKEHHPDQAMLHYGAYLEHSLNGLIVTAARRRGLRERETTQMLRDLSAVAKATWVFKLLGLASVPRPILTHLQAVSERRNAFVHYKWPRLDPDEPSDREDRKLVSLARDAEAAVRYFQRRDRQQVPRGLRAVPSVAEFTKYVLWLAPLIPKPLGPKGK